MKKAKGFSDGNFIILLKYYKSDSRIIYLFKIKILILSY